MKKSYAFLAGLALMSAFTACSSDDDVMNVAKTGTQLSIKSVGVEGVDTKAGITAAAFSGSEEIGVYINSGNLGAKYDQDVDYENIIYKATSGTAWATTQTITLSNIAGTVRAYYPYSADNGVYTPGQDDLPNDGTAIKLRVNSTQGTGIAGGAADDPNQIDYMWADPVTNVNSSKPDVRLQMNHALAMVSFQFKNSADVPYPGVGKITKIRLYNADGKSVLKAGPATMNINDGQITLDPTASVSDISVEPDAASLKDETTLNNQPRMLVYPAQATGANSIGAGDVKAEIVMDGVTFTLELPAITNGYEPNKNYQYNVTLKGVEMEIDEVSIKQWGLQAQGAVDMQDPDNQQRS